MKRIEQKFLELKSKKHCAFVGYICAGDPDYATSLAVLKAMPAAGVDIIELGVPFLDPAGDGAIIEAAGKRAIASGMSLNKTLEMVAEFRKSDKKTPLILMSYYNPILKFGLNKIFAKAAKSGVDGFLIVDLPLEEEQEITAEISRQKLDLIRLIAPTTNQDRAKKIAKNAGGFLYLISLLGVTGTAIADPKENKKNLQNLRQVSDLPIVVGFGIQTPNQAQAFSKIGADGVVIGSAIVREMAEKKSSNKIVTTVAKKLQEFSQKIKN
jgi:tryptophan synthase alpha chain